MFTALRECQDEKASRQTLTMISTTFPQKDTIFSADEVLRFREGWTDVEDERFLRYLRQHWLLGPYSGPPNLLEPSKNGTGHYSQVGQSEFVDMVRFFFLNSILYLQRNFFC